MDFHPNPTTTGISGAHGNNWRADSVTNMPEYGPARSPSSANGWAHMTIMSAAQKPVFTAENHRGELTAKHTLPAHSTIRAMAATTNTSNRPNTSISPTVTATAMPHPPTRCHTRTSDSEPRRNCPYLASTSRSRNLSVAL